MQNVACPTMIVISPKLMPNVWNVELRAMPVTTPGSAIGRTSRKLTDSRPKNEKRWTAMAASVPSTSAMTTAPRAAATEVVKAAMTVSFASASENQRNENPGGGHAMKPLTLKALMATIRRGR